MIITHGCSFTRYRWECWPHYIKFFEKNKLVKNLGMSASGNETISRMAVNSSLRNKNITKMYIMWSGADRYEVIEDQSSYDKIAEATYSRWDPDFNWHVWFGGHPVSEHHRYYQKYFLNQNQNRFRTLERILYSQMHLENIGVDYSMMLFKSDVVEHTNLSIAETMLYNKINWNKFIFYKDKLGLWEFAKENFPEHYVPGDDHPCPLAHYEWTKQIIYQGKKNLPAEYEQAIINRTKELINEYTR